MEKEKILIKCGSVGMMVLLGIIAFGFLCCLTAIILCVCKCCGGLMC